MTPAEKMRRYRARKATKKFGNGSTVTKPAASDATLRARIKELEAKLAAVLSMSAQQKLDATKRGWISSFSSVSMRRCVVVLRQPTMLYARTTRNYRRRTFTCGG
jgi:hypothetical protein